MQRESKTAQPPIYVSPKELANRWRVSRSSVDRIARANGFTRYCPGRGRNGTVRYLMEEVIAYEAKRQIKPAA